MTAPKLPEGLEPVAWRVSSDRSRVTSVTDSSARIASLREYPHTIIEPLVRLSDAQAALLAKEAECEVLRGALLKIARWELPATGKFWDDEKTRPTSYEAEYGSNGARAYMQALALAAIDSALLAEKEAK